MRDDYYFKFEKIKSKNISFHPKFAKFHFLFRKISFCDNVNFVTHLTNLNFLKIKSYKHLTQR